MIGSFRRAQQPYVLNSGAPLTSQDDHFPEISMFATSGISACQERCTSCTKRCVQPAVGSTYRGKQELSCAQTGAHEKSHPNTGIPVPAHFLRHLLRAPHRN